MRSPSAGGTERGLGAPGESARAGSAAPAVALLLLAGLALRLIIAYVLFPGSGFKTDISSFTSWAMTLAHYGPGGFYANAGFADYTPGYLYILWLVGLAGQALSSALGVDQATITGNLIKLPPILLDLLVAWVLYRTTIRWRGTLDERVPTSGQERPAADSPDGAPASGGSARGRSATPRRLHLLGLGVAALYLFNPVPWYDSALWGQVDALGALIVLGAILALVDGWSEGAAALAILAALVKPQFGIVLSPVVGIVLLRRHVFLPGSGPVPRIRSARLASWFAEEQGPWRIVSSVAAGLAVLFAVIVPFHLDLVGLVRLVVTTAGEYHYLTVNAYNGWALIADPGGASLAQAGTWSDDLVPLLGPIPGLPIGALLLVAGIALGVLQVASRDGRRSILLAAAYLSLAFFVLPTRVHERYLFPVFVLLPLLAMTSRRWLLAAAVLAGASFMNLHGVLTLPLYATPDIANLAGGELFRSEPGVTLSAFGHLAVFVVAVTALDPVRSLVRRMRGGHEPAVEAAPPVPVRRGTVPSPGGTAALEPIAVEPTPTARHGDDGRASRPRRGLGPVRRLLGPGSIRADRSRALHGEPGGRIDRLDVLVMALVVIAAMTTRTWRLAEPYGMHFDEVYHARTATEFLQDWRYGMPHDIYEFTHPHLAKYLIAVGIVAFGDDRVTGTSSLGTTVRAVALEPRWIDPVAPSARDGDRLYVATGTDVLAYDLAGRGVVATIGVPGATAVGVDASRHELYVAAGDGTIYSVPTSAMDAMRQAGDTGPDQRPDVTRLPGPGAGGAVQRLVAASDGSAILAVRSDGTLVSLDASTGAVLGRAAASAAQDTGPVAGVVALDAVNRVVVDTSKLADRSAAARAIASALGDTSGRVERLIASSSPGPVVVGAYLDPTTQDAVGSQLSSLGGAVTQSAGPIFAVSSGTTVRFLDASTLDQVYSISLDGPAGGMTLVRTGLDQPTMYVASGRSMRTIQLPATGQPVVSGSVPMPGPVTDVTWDAASNIVHALGTAQDGTSPTIYVVEPHGNAVFADARLPFTPVAWAFDQQPDRPGSDRQQILAFAADGSVATVDAGSHAFSWRILGVVAGALMAALLYLLARLLFRRRSVGLLVAAFSLVDGMFFVNSRIAMNDTYAALFVVAAYVVFAALWLGRWKGRSALIVGLPLLGLLLGLACASKWVGFYALGGIVLLTLLRSALGRVLALAAMVVMTGFFGYIAISHAPEIVNPATNLTFLFMMIGLTLLLAVAIAVRPVRWTVDELRLAVWGPLALGAVIAVTGVLLGPSLKGTPISQAQLVLAGFLFVLLAAAAYIAPTLLARFGAGPLAPPPTPDDPRSLLERPAPAPGGWLLPGSALSAPWIWALACMTILPLAVYILSYWPWIQLGNQWFSGFPAGHTGQTLWDLQVSMFNYHNDLRVPHPASSPWWAWPFDLKPVWFYQGSMANDTGASIYDTGNLVLFWLSVPAGAWTAWQAWRRRSLALALVVLAVAAQWFPWVWIDRATFQYHVYTALPFAFMALAYFVAELWHGPSRRTWALARVTAALAILGPALLWIAKGPLCVFAGTARVAPGSQVCGTVVNPVIVTQRVAAAAVVVALAVAAMAWTWLSSGDGRGPDRDTGGGLRRFAPTGTILVAAVLLLAAVQSIVPDVQFASVPLGSAGPLAVAALVGLLLCGPAWLVLRSRDPRRFALGVVIAAALWFVVWYPNISALPLPGSIVNMYQGLLPTWIYDFQFAVNTDPAAHPKLLAPWPLALAGAVAVGSLAVMYAARAWQVELALRRAEREGRWPEHAADVGG